MRRSTGRARTGVPHNPTNLRTGHREHWARGGAWREGAGPPSFREKKNAPPGVVCPTLRPVASLGAAPSPGVVEARSRDKYGGRNWVGCGKRRVLTKTNSDGAAAGSMAEAVRPPRRAKAKASRTKTKVRISPPPSRDRGGCALSPFPPLGPLQPGLPIS